MLLFFFCFGRGIRAAHCFLFWDGRGIRVAHRVLFRDGIPCCSCFFVLGQGSVLLIVFCFGRLNRVAHRFFVLGGDP